MKKVIYITILVSCVIGFSSCRGSGGKKVATEALEFIEKEAGSLERNAGRLERGAMVVEENANKASKSAEEEYNSYNSYQNIAKQRSGKIELKTASRRMRKLKRHLSLSLFHVHIAKATEWFMQRICTVT